MVNSRILRPPAERCFCRTVPSGSLKLPWCGRPDGRCACGQHRHQYRKGKEFNDRVSIAGEFVEHDRLHIGTTLRKEAAERLICRKDGQSKLGDNERSQTVLWESIVSFKTILVLLDESDDSAKRLEVACSLAQGHGAHLNALAVSQQLGTYMAGGIDAGAAYVDVGQIEESRQKAQRIANIARGQIDRHGVHGDVRWASHETFGLREAVAIQGRHADLTIVGQPVERNSLNLRDAIVEGALFSSGRPVLLLPASWDKLIKASHIVVAWDGSQQAARALSDAAPFLDQAAKTTVLIVDPQPGHDNIGPEPGADISAVLARHCSKVELDRIPSSGGSIAQALLRRAAATAADLIVMGSYGQSVWRESIFGGVSYEMTHKTTIPLFLSH